MQMVRVVSLCNQRVAVFNNYIHLEAMPSRHSTQQVTVAKNTLQFFRDRGHQPRYERLDNECSPALKSFLKEQGTIASTS